MHFVLEALWKI